MASMTLAFISYYTPNVKERLSQSGLHDTVSEACQVEARRELAWLAFADGQGVCILGQCFVGFIQLHLRLLQRGLSGLNIMLGSLDLVVLLLQPFLILLGQAHQHILQHGCHGVQGRVLRLQGSERAPSAARSKCYPQSRQTCSGQ